MSEKRNVKETTYKIKTDNDVITEKIIKNKSTGEVKHTIQNKDGEDLTPKNDKIHINQENAALYQTHLLNEVLKKLNVLPNILNQLIEMNYYIAHLEPEQSRKEGNIKEHFAKLGIELNG